jgi:hypothetical protein
MMEERKSDIFQRVRRAAELILSLLLVGLFTTGCASLSSLLEPDKKIESGQAVPYEIKLIPGKTTKDEILSSSGSPKGIWEEKNVSFYFWEESTKEERSWLDEWLFEKRKKCRKQGIPLTSIEWETCEQPEVKRVHAKKICFLMFDSNNVLKYFKVKEISDYPSGIGDELVEWYGNVTGQQHEFNRLNTVPVILRIITATIDGSKKWDWYHQTKIELASFQTGGVFRHQIPVKIEESLEEDGWVIFYVMPGDQYIFFKVGGYKVTAKAEIPISDAPIYIGSFHFDRKVEQRLFVNAWKNRHLVGIIDENDFARQVATKVFPEKLFGGTSLAATYEGPPKLTTPPHLALPPSD